MCEVKFIGHPAGKDEEDVARKCAKLALEEANVDTSSILDFKRK